MSSRNAYLSPQERATAPAFYEALKDAERALEGGAQASEAIRGATDILKAAGFKVQYLELLERDTFNPASRREAGRRYLLAGAVYLGSTRLIDNILIG